MLTGGRGKAGGIKLAERPDEAEEKARRRSSGSTSTATSSASSGSSRASDIAKEYYLSLTFDRGEKKPLFMFTTQGGVDIEEVAATSPEALVRLHVDPLEGFQPWQARALVYGAGVDDPDEQKQIAAIIGQLYAAFVEYDAMLCEINPLIVTPDGEVKALDSKFTVDDNALYRHPDVAEMRDLEAVSGRGARRAREGRHLRQARRRGRRSSANGAGLAMSTLDVITLAGGRPANFCDLGGGGDAQGVVDALEVITADPQVRSILFNIFGGITRCDEVARGILQALDADGIDAADRRPARRHERRGGAADPRGGRAAEPPRRADDARRGAARRGAGRVTRRLGRPRARPTAESAAHREGADLDLIVAWAAGAGDGARRRDRRRPRRAAAARGRDRGRDHRPGAGHAARRHLAAPRTCPSPTAASTSSPAARGAPLRRLRGGDRARWRASRASRCSSSTTASCCDDVEEAERLRDPSHVRNYTEPRSGARCSRCAGSTVEDVALRAPFELEPWLARTGCDGRGGRARPRAARPTASRTAG